MKHATRLVRRRMGDVKITDELSTKHTESLDISMSPYVEYVIFDCGDETCGPTHIYRNGWIVQ